MPDNIPAPSLPGKPVQIPDQFGERIAPHRRELFVHCYRMLGSPLDAEDAVQETMLRAYRRRSTFVRNISFRAWLYKIATNICLDMLGKKRRVLPSVAYPPANPQAALPDPIMDPIWLEPLATGMLGVSAPAHNPAARFTARESITLAFVAALQLLTPRQRAVLILRDVLDYRAKETAAILNMTLSAANSALHRARTTLARHDSDIPRSNVDAATINESLLVRYLQAWENADIEALIALLQEEATFAMPPWPVWYRGHADIRAILNREIFAGWTPGQDHLRPIWANAQPAFALYRRSAGQGEHQALALSVLTLTVTGDAIAAITVFLNPALFPAFGLPLTWDSK